MTSLQHCHIHQNGMGPRARGRTGTDAHHKSATRLYGVTIINLFSIMILILSVAIASSALNSFTPQYSSSSEPSNLVSSLRAGASDVIAIKEGANLDLNCSNAEQTEDMIISWTCNNKPASIKSNRIYVTDSGRLRIQSAKVGDSCNYRCEAADGFGTWSVFIKVIVVDRQLMNKLTAGSEPDYGSDPSAARDKKRAPMKGDPSKFANKEIILNDSQQEQHHLTSLGSSAVDSNYYGPSSEKDPMAVPAGASNPIAHTSLSVQIEPEQVTVKKKQSFSLNCRVNHSSHLKIPQIIWLKEFMGRPPSSLEDALQQNLIHLDNAYYHTLNWPRSISYSRASFCANSGLIIRNASFVHAGRYVCLSGYLNRLGVEPPIQQPAFNDEQDNNQKDLFEPPKIPPSVQYVIALASVKVEEDSKDGDDEFYYRLRWREHTFGDVIMRIFGTEGSIWKLSISMLLLGAAIIIICFYKLHTKCVPTLIGARSETRKRGTSADRINAKNSINHHLTVDASLIYTRDEQMKLNDSRHFNLMNRSAVINELERMTSSQPSSGDVDDVRASSTDKTYVAEGHTEHPPKPNLASSMNHPFYGIVPGEHVYSEIGDLNRTVVECLDENHHSSSSCYKVPNNLARDY